jgi:Flp pilus assembly protein TadD
MIMPRFRRTLGAAVLCGLLLSGCSTTGVSTHNNANPQEPVSLAALGVDQGGMPVGAAWPSIPASNQAILKGDQARRYLELGQENFRGDNFGHAETNFRKAVEITPDSVAAWAGLAASYDQLGRFDLADRAYDQLMKLKKNDARIMNNRGYSYMLRGDYKKAETWFAKAQDVDPSLEEVEGNLHLLAQVRQG